MKVPIINLIFYCIKGAKNIKVSTSIKQDVYLENGNLQMKFFLCVIGMVMIVEGLPYFAMPEKMKAMVLTIAGLDDKSLRKFGFLLMAFGLCVVYFAMKIV